MAYGKNKARKDWLMRAVPLGVGKLSGSKRALVFELRNRVIALMGDMAVAGFCAEPLSGVVGSKTLDASLLAVQKSCMDMNSVWREQARMRVKPALEECNKRYFSRLAGGLRFVDQMTPIVVGVDNPRRYFHIPESVQDIISTSEIAALKAIGEHGDSIALFHQVIVDSDPGALTHSQVAVLVDIHARAMQKHNVPVFAGDDFTLQLHIDARMIPANQRAEAMEVRSGVASLLADDRNRLYYRFLDISGLGARQDRIRLPLALSRKVAKRISSTSSDWASLILEISEHSFGVRLVAGKPKDELPTQVSAFVGRDFGYANTVSLSVVLADSCVDLDSLRSELSELKSKDVVKGFLEKARIHSSLQVVERIRFEGRNFLRTINTLCVRIDAFKSRIDLEYNKLNVLKGTIVHELGLQYGDSITSMMKERSLLVGQFFCVLGKIADLKRARRVLYKRITAIKKAWFGFLSNIEVALAKKYDAAIVREDLTVAAIVKEGPCYKGRVFNKMINNGSKGQYQKRATDKLLFNGVAEIVVPSWYTSRTCVKHSIVVDAKHRKGERIYLPCCELHHHADEHASDTIASYPLLKLNLTPAEVSTGFVTPASSAMGSTAIKAVSRHHVSNRCRDQHLRAYAPTGQGNLDQ
jgi:hypothetical protein